MPIEVTHLTHTYLPGSPFSATAIHDITLTIEDGEFIGILGHTGSGKTTFVQHLNGLLKPSEGRVVVDGTDITEKGVSLLNVRKKVGLVFQYPEYQLFEESVAKDVAFGPKNMGLTKEEIDERVRWAIAQVGLDYEAVAASSPFELSGGQMRRVAIAGVLAMRPKVLILDEPTAGLDPRGRRAILDMIRRLHAENRMTVIMVSHNMDDIATLATRLVVMGKGELQMTGAPRDIFKRRDELRAIGLGVPQGAELCYRLREQGFAIPEGLYLLSEVRDAILALAGKGAPAAESVDEPVAAMLAQARATPGPDAPEGTLPPNAGLAAGAPSQAVGALPADADNAAPSAMGAGGWSPDAGTSATPPDAGASPAERGRA